MWLLQITNILVADILYSETLWDGPVTKFIEIYFPCEIIVYLIKCFAQVLYLISPFLESLLSLWELTESQCSVIISVNIRKGYQIVEVLLQSQQ